MKTPNLSSIRFHLTNLFGLRPRFDYGVISVRPLIIYTHYDPSIWELLYKLRSYELHYLVVSRWTLQIDDQKEIAARLYAWSQKHPHHHLYHTAADPHELAVLNRLNIPSYLCGQNCLIDESIFHILPQTPKRFRAIYDARLTSFKRHELAANIRDLALITYETPLNRDSQYNDRTKNLLSHATWLNGPFAKINRSLSAQEVAQYLNQSSVGLILSKLEGANFASIQYLLCGLPVVTTRNIGGRDEFFSPEHVIWADDNPQSVSDAVEELIRRNLDPQTIRQTALQRVHNHRDRFKSLIADIVAPRPAPAWETYYFHKLVKRQTPLQLAKLKLQTFYKRLNPLPR
jgi:glycosyltransferase involved in cell wall biosynthesis